MRIQKVSNEDISRIVELERKLLDTTLGETFLKNEIENELSVYLKVVDDDNNLLGYAGYKVHDTGYEILNIVVDDKFHHMGIGSILVKEIISNAKKNKKNSIVLEVKEDNINAIKLYEKHEFKKELVKKNYYYDKDAFLYIWKDE